MSAEIIHAIAASLFILAAGYGTGYILTSRRTLSDWALEEAGLRTLLGLGVNSLALFLIGCWLWNVLVVYVVLAPAAIWTLYSLQNFRVSRTDLASPVTAISVGIVVLCFLGGLSKPSGGMGNDTISYHLMGPASWNSQRRISPVLDFSPTAFPATVETFFAAGMLLSNDRAPGIIDTFFFAILLIQVAGLTRSIGGSPAAIKLSALLLATMPAVVVFANNGFVDVAYACFVIAGIRFAVCPGSSEDLEVLSGAFAGLSAGTKYTGITFAGLCFFLYAGRRSRNLGWRRLILFPIVAFLIGSPWYIRNWVVLGSPIYPIPLILSGMFHSPTFPLPAILRFHEYILGRGQGIGLGIRYLFILPFTYTYYTAYFHGGGGIGLAPLAFTPLALYRTKDQKESRYLFYMAVALTVIWFFTDQESRFLISVVCITTAFAGLGSDIALRQFNGTTALLSASIIMISVVYGILIIGSDALPQLSWLNGANAEAAQRAKAIPYYGALEYLNRTDNVKRVLVLDATAPTFNAYVSTYYLLKPYLRVIGPYGETPIRSLTTQDEALREAGNMGITHVLEVGPKWPPASAVGCKHFDLVFSEDDARIYHCY